MNLGFQISDSEFRDLLNTSTGLVQILDLALTYLLAS